MELDVLITILKVSMLFTFDTIQRVSINRNIDGGLSIRILDKEKQYYFFKSPIPKDKSCLALYQHIVELYISINTSVYPVTESLNACSEFLKTKHIEGD